MKIYVVGIGAEGEKTLTAEARDAINEAGLLVGAERMLSPFARLGKETFVGYKPADIARRLAEYEGGSAAALMSGDCGFFSGAKKLLPLLEGRDVRVIPGISSAAYFFARLGKSYENTKFVTLHGEASNVAVNVKLNESCFFLLGGGVSAAEVCRRLCEYGLGNVSVSVGAELGYPGETVITGKASEFADVSVGGLAVLTTENPEALRGVPSSIGDDHFTRGRIPMTKAEVRGAAVAKLGVREDSVVWDVGCGTGSVSVEAAYRCPDGRVFAFDKNPEAVALTAENARLFGCDNIEAAEGSCPEALKDAPPPDAVFIGGASGNIGGIFSAIYEKNSSANIVVTAVTLETLYDADEAFKSRGAEPEIVQIAVTRTKRVGSRAMLEAQNPVFVVSGRLK